MKKQHFFKAVICSMILCTVFSLCGCEKTTSKSSSNSAQTSAVATSSKDSSKDKSNTVEKSALDENKSVIHCDTSNVLANTYYKSFFYGDSKDQTVKAGWVIPKGKYRADVVNTKTWVQISIYVAKSGTIEPESTEKNQKPLLLKKGETAVIEVDGNEYIYITEPDYITLTPISE